MGKEEGSTRAVKLWIHQVRPALSCLYTALTLNWALPHSKIFPQQSVESFHKEVRQLLKAELEGLDPTAILTTKKLIKAGMNDKNDFDAINLRESYGM